MMIKTKLEGSFSVKVIRDGEIINELPRHNNLILSNKMSTISIIGNNLHVGTGNTAPTYNDAGLDSQIATINGTGWTENSPTLNGSVYEKEAVNTFTFSIGAVVGNLAELGVSPSSNPTTTFHTRALFKDGAGDPTVVTVTAADQLVVTYYVKKYITMTPVTSSVLSGGNTIDYTVRPCITSVGNSGSGAQYPASIYQADSGANLYLFINDANRISVDPTTYAATLIDSGGDASPEGSSSVALTATGNEVTHTITFPISTGNFQWVAGTVATNNFSSLNSIMFQIEFNGPNYITKNNTEIVTFKLKEIVEQVV